MDNFYMITNMLKDGGLRITKEIMGYIEQNGRHCILSEKDEEGHIIPGTVPKGMDCALSFFCCVIVSIALIHWLSKLS